MAQRTLDSSFWDDEDVARLSFGERLLLMCMITDVSLSDDYGNLPASARTLKKHAFGYDDDVTVAQVEKWRESILAKCRNVKLYKVGGQEYITLLKFQQWQELRYQRKTQIPPPPGTIAAQAIEPEPVIETIDEVTEEPQEISENSGNVSKNCEKFPLCSVVLSSEELGSEGLCSSAREIPAKRPAEPAKVQPVQPLQAFSFSEPEGVTASGGSSKPPDIRNQCAAAIDYWIQVGKRRGMHDDDKYQISAMVKSYGWERVKAAMDAEPQGALWNIQKRLLTPQPAEPVTVTA
jgi:hypothetical protein